MTAFAICSHEPEPGVASKRDWRPEIRGVLILDDASVIVRGESRCGLPDGNNHIQVAICRRCRCLYMLGYA